MPLPSQWKNTPLKDAVSKIPDPRRDYVSRVVPKGSGRVRKGNTGGSSKKSGTPQTAEEVVEVMKGERPLDTKSLSPTVVAGSGSRVISESRSDRYERSYENIQEAEERFGELGEDIPGPDPFERTSERITSYRERLYTPQEHRTSEYLRGQGITPEMYSRLEKVEIPEHTVSDYPEDAKGSSLVRFEGRTFDPDEQSYRELVEYLSARSEDIGRQEAIYEYQKTGRVPGWYRDRVEVPPEVGFVGAGEEYVKESFEMSMGLNEKVSPDFVGPVRPSEFEQAFSSGYEQLTPVEKGQFYDKFIEKGQYPEGTKFVPRGDGGYDVIIPSETQLQLSKHVRGKIQKLPPVIGQMASFGHGIADTSYSLAKPLFDLFGFSEEYKVGMSAAMASALHPLDVKGTRSEFAEIYPKTRYGIHHPSYIDVAFEPLGLSPKGSTSFLFGDPFYAMGGLAGEAAQFVAFTEAGKGVKFVAGTTTKAGVRTGARYIPKVYGKFTRVFPEERLLSTGARRITQTGFMRNLYNWGARGYKPVARLAPAGTSKSLETLIHGEQATTRIVKRKIFEGGGQRLERMFLSPKEYARATSKLQEKVGTTMILGFPRTADDVASAYLKHTSVKGMFRPRLVTSEKAVYTFMKRPVVASSDDFLNKGLLGAKKSEGGFFRAGPVDDVLKSFDDFGEMSYWTRMKPYEARYLIDDIIDVEKTARFGIDDVYDVGRGGYQMKKIASVGMLYEKKLVRPQVPILGSRSTKMKFFEKLQKSGLVSIQSPDTPMSAWAKQASKARGGWWRKHMGFFGDVRGSQVLVPQLEYGVTSVKPTGTRALGKLGLISQLQATQVPMTIPVTSLSRVGYGASRVFNRPLMSFFSPDMIQESRSDLGFKSELMQEALLGLKQRTKQRRKTDFLDDVIFDQGVRQTPETALGMMLGLRSDFVSKSMQDTMVVSEGDTETVPMKMFGGVTPSLRTMPFVPPFIDMPLKMDVEFKRRPGKRKQGYREWKTPVGMYWLGG